MGSFSFKKNEEEKPHNISSVWQTGAQLLVSKRFLVAIGL
jgi:hypothetical protein